MNNDSFVIFWVFLLLIVNIFSCGKKQTKHSINTTEENLVNEEMIFDKKVESVDIYCWCFSLFPYQYLKKGDALVIKDYLNREVKDLYNCQTPINIKAGDIIKKTNYRGSIEGSKNVERFQNYFFSEFKKIENYDIGTDSRLVFKILFEDESISYLTYYSNSRMILNDSLLVEYPSRVDSFLLNLNSSFDFICPD